MINEETVIEYIEHELSKRLSPSFDVTVSSDRVIGKGNQFYITVCIQDAFTIRDVDVYKEVDITPTINKSINTIISQVESATTLELTKLLTFLDTVGAALDSPEGWDNSEDTWMEYVDKTGVPTNHEYHFTDWVEVGPAMKGLAAMIRTGVFK